MNDELGVLTKKLIKLAIEKRLRDELRLAAPELPEEVREDLYEKMFRPVMVMMMLKLKEVIKR